MTALCAVGPGPGQAPIRARIRVRVRVKVRVTVRVRVGVRVRVRLSTQYIRAKSGGGVVGSDLVATPGAVHNTCIELQLLIIPQQHINIPPRPLLFTINRLKSRLRGA